MHVHAHGAGSPTRVLKISLGVTLGYIVLLVVAGIRAHSLALLSEAGHNLSDFLALLLSLVALYLLRGLPEATAPRARAGRRDDVGCGCGRPDEWGDCVVAVSVDGALGRRRREHPQRAVA